MTPRPSRNMYLSINFLFDDSCPQIYLPFQYILMPFKWAGAVAILNCDLVVASCESFELICVKVWTAIGRKDNFERGGLLKKIFDVIDNFGIPFAVRQFEDFKCGSVTVQLDKVEVCELKPRVLTEDKGGLVWRWTSNWVTKVLSTT